MPGQDSGVPMGQREVGAKVTAERTGAIVLPARDHAAGLNVCPRRVQRATTAAVRLSTEARGLRRERHLDASVGLNAHAIGCCTSCRERPAAACIQGDESQFQALTLIASVDANVSRGMYKKRDRCAHRGLTAVALVADIVDDGRTCGPSSG